MPIHDWTRVDAGIFDHFRDGCNGGLLPDDWYALVERVVDHSQFTAPRFAAYAHTRNHIAIRHSREDRLASCAEIISPGDKDAAARSQCLLTNRLNF